MIGHFLRDVFSKQAAKTPLHSLRYLFAKARGKIIEKSAACQFHYATRLADFGGVSHRIGGSDRIYAVQKSSNLWDLYRLRLKAYQWVPSQPGRIGFSLPICSFNKVAREIPTEIKEHIFIECQKQKKYGMDLETIEELIKR